MKIGYPCINRTIGCCANKAFRLKSYSPEKLIETIRNNLDCLRKILEYNVHHNIFFFRISSDVIPFASHDICDFDWQSHFQQEFRDIGGYIRRHDMRISMHPDQFTLINAQDAGIFERSRRELQYHADFLDALELDTTAKIQIHVGGVYGDRSASMARFVKRYHMLDSFITRRLVIENDDVSYPLADCLELHKDTGVPVLYDEFHNAVNPSGFDSSSALGGVSVTWRQCDGVPMVDYSSQQAGAKKGSHTWEIDIHDFSLFLERIKPYNCDIMLEIKNKEASAIAALAVIASEQHTGASA
ncbi:MAG: UV DNA damage repair endonuclease UvsE [Candidatus Auribacter fodinae]|jgi:UV DNA damage endonuclease|uniref:UV DNA damage repair endonuclease UvsE n=1 Tax=Candidatus Auribacter fodinae TaxID=2093366 RepID=A0A3A4R6P8_9BACT|nr:MAG: UV DNA damage repair endonuclease UvsE [Candidatus Auribacter fodinae]